jgi:site-specific recombinase XerC
MSKPTTPGEAPSFAALVQIFFAEHLTQQRAMSPRTVATYRDAFVLFLNFAERQLHKQPTEIQLAASSTIWSMTVEIRYVAAMRDWRRCEPS